LVSNLVPEWSETTLDNVRGHAVPRSGDVLRRTTTRGHGAGRHAPEGSQRRGAQRCRRSGPRRRRHPWPTTRSSSS